MPTLPDFISIQRKSQSPQMVQTPTKPWTLEEFLELPETEPASEYVDGQIIQKPMPYLIRVKTAIFLSNQ